MRVGAAVLGLALPASGVGLFAKGAGDVPADVFYGLATTLVLGGAAVVAAALLLRSR